jgi:hypothetical protein
MEDIGYIILLIFGGITLLCFIGFIVTPNKKYLKMLDSKKGSTVYRVNGFGTCMYGRKILDADQMSFYGFEPIENKGKWYYPIARFKTIFISALWIPFIPFKTQIIIDREDSSFYALPVETYWRQAFAILTVTYFMFFFITVTVVFGLIGIIVLIIGGFIALIWLIFSKNNTPEEKNMIDEKKDIIKEELRDEERVGSRLGISQDEEAELIRKLKHIEIDLIYGEKQGSDFDILERYMSDLSPKQKLKVFYYGKMMEEWGMRHGHEGIKLD